MRRWPILLAAEADIVQEIGHPATLFQWWKREWHQRAARAGVTAPAGQPLHRLNG